MFRRVRGDAEGRAFRGAAGVRSPTANGFSSTCWSAAVGLSMRSTRFEAPIFRHDTSYWPWTPESHSVARAPGHGGRPSSSAGRGASRSPGEEVAPGGQPVAETRGSYSVGVDRPARPPLLLVQWSLKLFLDGADEASSASTLNDAPVPGAETVTAQIFSMGAPRPDGVNWNEHRRRMPALMANRP